MNPTSAQDLVNMGFYGYAGWNDAEALADYQATGGAGKGELTNPAGVAGGGGGVLGATAGGNDLVNLARQSLELQREFSKPAIETLQGAVGDVRQRYQNLLETFKPQVENTATTEFGRRGIPISSTAAQEGITRKVSDFQKNLAAQESADVTPLQVAIAQMQAGGSTGDILGNALQLQQLGENRRQFDISTDLARDRLAQQNTGGGGSGVSSGIIDFDSLYNSFTSTPQQTTPTTSSTSTSNLSGADAFKQRVLSGGVPQATVTTSSPSSGSGNFLSRIFQPKFFGGA